MIKMPLSKYKYTTFWINQADDLVKSLNDMGEQGWQVVHIEEVGVMHMSHKGIAMRRVL